MHGCSATRPQVPAAPAAAVPDSVRFVDRSVWARLPPSLIHWSFKGEAGGGGEGSGFPDLREELLLLQGLTALQRLYSACTHVGAIHTDSAGRADRPCCGPDPLHIDNVRELKSDGLRLIVLKGLPS
jgi:hypothetical protein